MPRRPLGSSTSTSSSSSTSFTNRFASRLSSSPSVNHTNSSRNSNNNRIPNRNKGILLIFIGVTFFGCVFWFSFFHRSTAASIPLLGTLFQDLDKTFNSQSNTRLPSLQSQYGAAHMQNLIAQSNNNIRGSNQDTPKQFIDVQHQPHNKPIIATNLQNGMQEHVHKSVEQGKRVEELDRLKREQAKLEEEIRKESLQGSSSTSTTNAIVESESEENTNTESWISRHRRIKRERRQQRQRQRREQQEMEGNEEEQSQDNREPLRAPLPIGGIAPVRAVDETVQTINENNNNGLASLPDVLHPPPLPPNTADPAILAQLEQQKQQLLQSGANPNTIPLPPPPPMGVLPPPMLNNPSPQQPPQSIPGQAPPPLMNNPSTSIEGVYCSNSNQPRSQHPLLFNERYMKDTVLPKEKCENFFGNTWLRSFADSRREVCSPGNSNTGSRIWRYDAATGARFSWMKNVKIDFGKMRTV